MKIEVWTSIIMLERGDITSYRADVIVNAANSSLLGGGGVDGAIHRVGGPAILKECKQIRKERSACPPGDAVMTTAGNLLAQRVVHAVGPIWFGGNRGEAEILARCYEKSLELTREEGLRTIAFPSISTGAYGYPVVEAAKVALRTVHRVLAAHPDEIDRVTWVLFDESTYHAYADELARLGH